MTIKAKIKVVSTLIKTIISNPKSIFLLLEDESIYKKKLKNKYGLDRLETIDITNFLKDNKGEICSYTFLEGSSMVTDIALLKALAANFENCEYLELGTWRGESIINVSKVAAHCTSINLSAEEISKIFKNDEYAAQHNCLIRDTENITTIYANTQSFDFSILNKKFDLIFVDADHSYEAVKNDTRNVFSLLRDENSIIVWHDCGFNAESPRYSVINAILDATPVEYQKHIYHVSNSMCGIFTRRAYETYKIKQPHRPDKVFNVNIECSSI